MKSLLAIVVAILMVFTVFLVITPAVAAPNENANEKAHERATFQIPEHAVEISPGIYYLGKHVADGEIIEGIMALHHKENHNKGGPGNGEDPPEDPPVDPPVSDCYSFLANGYKWKKAENWFVNTSNEKGLDGDQVVTILSDSISKWESEAGKNILGNPIVTTATLSAETINPPGPDGNNEVYFADINPNGIIGVTIVWYQTFPPGKVGLMEWDQVYNDGDFSWSIGDPVDPGAMDFENIASHELGHSVGLGHPQPEDDITCVDETMYWQASEEEINKRDLFSGDIAGIQTLY